MLDGMTNIKASEVLKEIKYYTEDLPPYSPDEVAEALEMAIQALEAQPQCDKCKFSDRSIEEEPCIDCKVPQESFYEPMRILEGEADDSN